MAINLLSDRGFQDLLRRMNFPEMGRGAFRAVAAVTRPGNCGSGIQTDSSGRNYIFHLFCPPGDCPYELFQVNAPNVRKV